MKFSEERYYKLNRILLSTTGLWPYVNIKNRQLRFIILLLVMLSFVGAQLLKLFISECNVDTVLKILSIDTFFIIMLLKYITFYIFMDNVKLFRKYILDSWSNLADDNEIEIIHRQAKAGRISTIFVTMAVYFITIFCIFMQYLTCLFDIIRPMNVSRPHPNLIQAEYFFDQQKYFHIMAMHLNIGLITFTTTGLATETFSLTNALYAFGLFKIASYRMKDILKGNHPQICTAKNYVASRNRIIDAVNMHRRAIQYSELLKESFGPMYLIMFIGFVVSTSMNLFYLVRIITSRDNFVEIIQHILFIIVHLIILILANYAGQQFINCDTNIYQTICNTQWYNAPLKTQKMILFLIQKTTKCYKVDAGGMFSPSLEGLATGLSMSVSYFTVLCSV